MQFKKIILPYILVGVFLGLLFPCLGLFVCVNFLYPNEYSYTIMGIHKDFPLMWIIDTAPFVLGILSFFVGTKINRLKNNVLLEIKEANEILVSKNKEQEFLINEKIMLLKEVHHRVKNNLQAVTSLLNLQGKYTNNSQFENLFKNCQNRIKSMLIIHEMLYNSEDVSKLNYVDYLQKLVSELVLSMKGKEHNIELDIDIPDIELDIDTSIPLGLLVNEIITNSLKYGIVNETPGSIHLKIEKKNDNSYELLIGDNGVGFNEDANFHNSTTLGLKLIKRLIVQLKGTIEKLSSEKGTNYVITFPIIN